MNSTNTTNRAYDYFVSYSFGTGTGMTQISTREPIESWQTLIEIATMIGKNNGLPPVTITGYQLMSGPDRSADTRLSDVAARVAGLIAWAQHELADEHTDSHQVAETLIDRLGALAALTSNS